MNPSWSDVPRNWKLALTVIVIGFIGCLSLLTILLGRFYSDKEILSGFPANEYLIPFAALLMSAFAGAAVGAFFFHGRTRRSVLQPILEVSKVLNTIAETGNFSVRLPDRQDLPFGLSQTMNLLLTQIQLQDKALRRSEERIRFALESARVGIWELNVSSGLLHCSETVQSILGAGRIGPSTPIGSFLKSLDPSVRRQLLKTFARSQRKRTSFETEFQTAGRRGEVFWLGLKGQFIFEESRTPSCLVGILIDITDRIRTEEILRELTNKLELAMEGISRIDQNGRFVSVNHAFAQLFEKDEEELLGVEWFSLILPEDQRELQQALVRLAGRDRVSTEVRVRRKDGSMIWIEMVIVSARAGHYAFVRDITERKAAEESLSNVNLALEQKVEERTRELQQAIHELESFSYSISHDLRAPLRAIQGFVRVLTEEYGPQLDAEAERIIGVVDKNTIYLSRLIDDLWSFSRLARREVKQVPVGVRSLVESVFKEFHQMEKDRKIELRLGNLPGVTGDPVMIRQVFANLIGNAVKFTRPNLEALIEVGTIERNQETIFFVKDNGVGFDPQHLGKLFNIFQRLHTQEEFEGSGVGLAIVRRVVQKHGGEVWAEAEEGKGATFYFSFPFPPEAPVK